MMPPAALDNRAKADGHSIPPERIEPIEKGATWLRDCVATLKTYLKQRPRP
jgi:hypothetical protein